MTITPHCPSRAPIALQAPSRRQALMLLGGCAGGAVLLAARPALSQARHRIEALNRHPQDRRRTMVFSPEILRVDPGAMVAFVPVDRGHNVESFDDMLPEGAAPFSTGINQSLEHRFEVEGIHVYFCRPHRMMGMIGAVLVGDVTRNLEAVRAAGGELGPRPLRERFTALMAEIDAAARLGEG